MENIPSWHGMAPNDEEYARAIADIEEDFNVRKNVGRPTREAYGDEILELGKKKILISISWIVISENPAKRLNFRSSFRDSM